MPGQNFSAGPISFGGFEQPRPFGTEDENVISKGLKHIK
jgi:hypothetical protein